MTGNFVEKETHSQLIRRYVFQLHVKVWLVEFKETFRVTPHQFPQK